MSRPKLCDVIGKIDFLATKMRDEYSDSLLNPCCQICDFEREIGDDITFEEVKNAFPVFIKKVAINNYPAMVSAKDPESHSGTHRIAFNTANALANLLRRVVEEADDPKVTAAAGELLLNAWLDIVRVGPQSTQVAVMDILADKSNPRLQDYVPTLPPTQIATILKAMYINLQCPKVETNRQEFAFKLRCRLSVMYENFTAKQLAAVQSEFLDIYYNYHKQLQTLPEDVAAEMKYIVRSLGEKFEQENPYLHLKHTETFKKHITMIKDMACSDAMGEDTPVVDISYLALKHIVNALTEEMGSMLEQVFDHLMKTLVAMSKHPRGRKYGRRIYDCYTRQLFEVMKDKGKEPSDAVFASCQYMISEVSSNGEVSSEMEGMIRIAQDGVITKIIQDQATKAKPILLMVKHLLLSGKMDLIGLAAKAIDNAEYGKKGKVFVWKNLVPEAIMLIDVVGKQPIEKMDENMSHTCTGLYRTIQAYGSFIDKLLHILRKGKVIPDIQTALVECIFNCLESPTADRAEIAAECVSDEFLDLSTVDGKLVTEMLQRLLKLLKNRDREWYKMDIMGTTKSLLSFIMSSYFGKDNVMTKEHNNLLLSILATCGEGDSIEDQFYQEEEPDRTSVYYQIYTNLFSHLVRFHNKNKTGEWLAEAMPDLMKWASIAVQEKHNDVMQAMCRVIHDVTPTTPILLKDYLPNIMAMYIDVKKTNKLLWNSVKSLYPLNPSAVHSRLQDIFTIMKDSDENSKSLMIDFLQTISQKHAEVFTKDHVSSLLKSCGNDDHVNLSLLMIINDIANVNTKVVAPHFPTLIDDRTFKPASLIIRAGLLACIGRINEKLGTSTIDYLMKFGDSKDQIISLTVLSSILGMMEKHVNYMQKYRAKLQTWKKKRSEIKDVCHQMILILDGISIEGVFEDVKQQKEDIEELDTKVDSTIDTVQNIGDNVVDHHYQLTGVRQDIEGIEERVDDAEDNIAETKTKVEEIDNKTMTNAPKWSRDLTKLMNLKTDNDWRFLASRLGYTNTDIRAWAQHNDPCMALLSEWYATHKTSEASHAVLTALQEMNRIDGAAIVENAMKAADGVVEDEEFEYASPPPIFLSYQWSMQDEVKHLQRHLNMAGYVCWMDIGQMGGGDKLFAKIDTGIRAAKVVICCVTEKYAQSPNCNREVNLSVNLGKPIIPLLMEKMNWPPKGSMGPIFSEYLFIRFFQRGNEQTSDKRYWPVPKFQELLMQLNYFTEPDAKLIKKEYKDWWKPIVEDIVINKRKPKTNTSEVRTTTQGKGNAQPLVFLSYQWGKQPQIKNLYQSLTNLGYTVWMDIYQMGGGDSLYDKIDRGLRGCKAVVSCVTTKYSLSANCRREVSLADALKKPIIPLLLEQIKWPPDGPMSMVFTELLYINCYRDTNVQMSWKGPTFDELKVKLQKHITEAVPSNPEINSSKSRSGSTVGIAKPKPVTGQTPSNTKKNATAAASTPKPDANTKPRSNQNTVTKTLPVTNTEHGTGVNLTRPNYNGKTSQATTRSISKAPAASNMATGSKETATNSVIRSNPKTSQVKPVTGSTHLDTTNSVSVKQDTNNKTASKVKLVSTSKNPTTANMQNPSNTGSQLKNVTMAEPTRKSETQSTSKSCILM